MTLTEMAEKLKVSHTTVSRALNPEKAHLISEPIRKRIQAYAARVRYVPNRTAQELVRGRSQTIGVIVSTVFSSVFFSDYIAKVLSGIYAVLQENSRFGCKLIVLPRGSTLQDSDVHILRTGADGLLVSSIGDFAASQFELLARELAGRWHLPVVGLSMDCRPGRGLSVVSFSNREAARAAVTHLIRKGHERIGLIWADNGSNDVRERIASYKEVLKDHRLVVKPELTAKGDFLTESGYRATLTLLKEGGPKPTAIFCINDEMAIGAMRALKALRLRCPEDVAVMGFDGLDLGKFVDPRLTTVRQPVKEIAEAGAKLLIDLLEGRQKGPVALNIPAELIIRDSA
jgi:DNA-binding LacI/PurR family transcriptional regulator